MRATRILSFALLLLALPAAAQTTFDWSMVGSTGIAPDPGAGHEFTGPSFKHSAFRTGTLRARYPVTNTFGSASDDSPAWTTLWASYLDNSSSGSVTVKLFKVDECTNTETTLCTITSSDGSSAQCSSCTFSSSDIDFANNSYYIEVAIARTTTAASEQLHVVGIQ